MTAFSCSPSSSSRSSCAMVSFPAPVGGTPLTIDFAPSIVFSALYGLLIPLMVYRMCGRRSRTTLLIGTLSFVVERCAIFGLRAWQSRNEKSRQESGLLDYMQISFAMGSIGIANDLVAIVRCLLVNPTYGFKRFPESPAAKTKEYVVSPPVDGTNDMPRTRFRMRRLSGILGMLYLASMIPCVIANSAFYRTLQQQYWADRVYELRLASSAIGILLAVSLFTSVLWGKRKLERISIRGVVVASVLVALITIISVYRLIVMPLRVTSLSDPVRTNTSSGKAAFYVFHVLPEWLSSVILFGAQTRKIFGTGPCGDVRSKDETEEQKMKRLDKEAKKATKKAEKAAKARAAGIDLEMNEKEVQLVEKVDLVSSPVAMWTFK
ncbi:hypothetical protein CPB83DRAFT_864127 [Crepidotus variabilis]|uniref:Uncharacterized protein n=1 Tax=Crepidotus variabilis TaxID=179855 RepID=A0A9P6E4Z6_9AGAR|nr:hypothetical protein CPB83DRAFT_864127 [Crepidotus variabilis]